MDSDAITRRQELGRLRETPQGQRLADAIAPLERNEEPEGLVFHYTTASAALQILEEGAFRATSLQHMNDPREWRYGEAIIEDSRKRLRETTSPSSLAGRWLESVTFPLLEEGTSAYVISFSEIGDSLPQWRAYAEDGSGIALGLDLREIPFGTWFRDETVLFLVRVEYDEKVQQRIALDWLSAAVNYLESEEKRSTSEAERETASRVAKELMPRWMTRARLSFKDPAWSHEREWRIVALVSGTPRWYDVKMVNRASRIVPYIEGAFLFHGAPYPLREVWLGPCRDQKSDDAVLSEYLKNRWNGDPRVKRSPIEYRR